MKKAMISVLIVLLLLFSRHTLPAAGRDEMLLTSRYKQEGLRFLKFHLRFH